MGIRKLFGTPTVDAGIFWTNVVDVEGWRVQHNQTLQDVSPLKPYRLLNPEGYLWASADSAEEMANAMPELIKEFGKKDPLFTYQEVIDHLTTVAELLLRHALTKR